MYTVRSTLYWACFLLVLFAMFSEIALATSSGRNSLKSTEGNVQTEIDFTNSMNEPVAIYWIDYDGNEKFYALLQPEERYTQHTFVTHPWIVMTVSGNQIVGSAIGRVGKQTLEVTQPAGRSSTQAPQQAQQAQQGTDTQSEKEYWGAYAEAGSYSDDTQGYGVSWNYSSPKKAIDRAIEECTKRHTHDDCLEYITVFSTSSKRHGAYDDRYTVSGYDDVRIFRHRCVGVVKDGPDIIGIFANSENEAADPSNALISVNRGAGLIQVECNHR